jgi:riboflavin biosynthesis pyrimidine reductase
VSAVSDRSSNHDALNERVLANLVVAPNGATTSGGRSASLSSATDRQRFHEIRSRARAIAIGGNTYRNEPYSNTKLPLFVATRQARSDRGLPANCRFINKAPDEVIEIALSEYGAPVLIEGGVKFLLPLLEKRLIDTLYVTRSNKLGDADFLDNNQLQLHYVRKSVEKLHDVEFEVWNPK